LDNLILYAIEKLGAKVYFFGECVWATILKINTLHFKLAIVGGKREEILPLLDKYEIRPVKLTLLVKDGDTTYEFYFPIDIDSIPLDPIPLNNAILSLDGQMYRADDLQNRTIRIHISTFLDYPEELLRVCRIAAQTNFTIDVATWIAMRDHARLIRTVVKTNPRYIGQQLNLMLLSKYPHVGFKVMLETGLLEYILPELTECNNIAQSRRGKETNVFKHTLLALQASEPSMLIRWSMLFHDMAKPGTMEITTDGKMHFFKHDTLGARLAEEYMTKYKLDTETIKGVKVLIENHMFDADPKLTPKGVRRLIRRVGKEYIYELIKVREADRLGAENPPTNDKIDLLKQKISKELPNV
jgi:putative nucleotidyltransferase with HDIG domain